MNVTQTYQFTFLWSHSPLKNTGLVRDINHLIKLTALFGIIIGFYLKDESNEM